MRCVEARWARTVATLLVAVALALLAVGNGAAAGPPGGSSAISQYVEMVPTADGGAAPSMAGTAPAAKPAVTPSAVLRVERKIDKQGGANANDLKAVALSPVYGAPQDSLTLGSTPKRLLLPNDRVSLLTASAGAVVSSPSLLALLLAMVALTAAISFASFRRHRLEADAYSPWLRALQPPGTPPRAND